MKTLTFVGILALSVLVFAEMVRADTVVPPTTSLINTYDPNGNLVSGDGKYYEYNDANQLVRVRNGDQTGPVIAEYFYDYTGQRVKKVENGVPTYYVGNHYETTVVAGKAEGTSYFFADGERVAKKDPSGSCFFFHPDHLGGVNVVTDGNKAVVATTSYLPFGEIRQGGAEKYSYTGKEKDKATELYYFHSRYNHPELKHFTQADDADPDVSDPQDLNRYAYVGNNPLSYVDPDGHKKKHHTKKEEKALAKVRAGKNAQKKAENKEKEKIRAAADYAKHNKANQIAGLIVTDNKDNNKTYSLQAKQDINNEPQEGYLPELSESQDDLNTRYYQLHPKEKSLLDSALTSTASFARKVKWVVGPIDEALSYGGGKLGDFGDIPDPGLELLSDLIPKIGSWVLSGHSAK